MNAKIQKFSDPATLADSFANDFAQWLGDQSQPIVTVALSGGSTPRLLFERWAGEFAGEIDWSRVRLFWVDERCVPPSDSDSNFGVANDIFLSKVDLPADQLHRVHGESNPDDERTRYADEIDRFVRKDSDGVPQFDLVVLGMGDDGHTASIFPHQMEFLTSSDVCEVATHPTSGQKRITLTGPVINHAKKVVFLITGANKKGVLVDVVKKTGLFKTYPASFIDATDLTFYVDEDAASGL
ncbi:6-phosphogluconolactonase [Rubripirellula tenax]|uniref:6-phosphogluconolactonase n=1 Tax=Rubripirellula tenax TaxID=2528015 RepID=A0A5C6EGD8_9BACT|nr:6-phosphogluconolactonase [Rubripirellula tenax]TWU48883.1 6-phosphogluconolactonase [Rubripirellula tenax]